MTRVSSISLGEVFEGTGTSHRSLRQAEVQSFVAANVSHLKIAPLASELSYHVGFLITQGTISKKDLTKLEEKFGETTLSSDHTSGRMQVLISIEEKQPSKPKKTVTMNLESAQKSNNNNNNPVENSNKYTKNYSLAIPQDDNEIVPGPESRKKPSRYETARSLSPDKRSHEISQASTQHKEHISKWTWVKIAGLVGSIIGLINELL